MDAIRINKHDSKVLKWLQSATSKDIDRPVLMGINTDGNHAACDGWRLHVVPSFGIVGLPDGTRQYGKIPTDGLVEIPEPSPYDFPTYNQIIPRDEPDHNSDEPVCEIAVNPQFLIDALKGFVKSSPETCFLRMRGPNHPLEIQGKIETNDESTPAYALVMPMHLDNNNWKP